MRHITIRDVTIREGGEVPGVHLSLTQQLKLAKALAQIGVKFLEVAGPETTQKGIRLARALLREQLQLRPVFLLNLLDLNLEHKADLVSEVCGEHDMVDFLLPTSPVRLRALGIGKQQMQKRGFAALNRLRTRYQFQGGLGLVDAMRADIRFLAHISEEARETVRYLVLYDTVGAGTPERIKEFVTTIKAGVGTLPVFVHCHNDFGLATANSLAGAAAGADGVDVSVNGLGDRSGNAALEEVVVGLELLYNFRTDITLTGLTQLARLVESISRVKNSPLKPIVGTFSFTHAAPSHIPILQAKHPEVFEPFEPQLVGSKRKVVEKT